MPNPEQNKRDEVVHPCPDDYNNPQIKMNETQSAREKIIYEYWFETTPVYKVADEDWELHDVFLKYFSNGYPTFITVFRKRINHLIANAPKT